MKCYDTQTHYFDSHRKNLEWHKIQHNLFTKCSHCLHEFLLFSINELIVFIYGYSYLKFLEVSVKLLLTVSLSTLVNLTAKVVKFAAEALDFQLQILLLHSENINSRDFNRCIMYQIMNT